MPDKCQGYPSRNPQIQGCCSEQIFIGYMLAKLREKLIAPPCPKCMETFQIQLIDWPQEVKWRCRKCGLKYKTSGAIGDSAIIMYSAELV